MHSILRILELQRLIFTGCDRKSLPRLARTCKTFHETALDVLWRDDASIVSLLQVMPQDLWFIGCRDRTFVPSIPLVVSLAPLIFSSAAFSQIDHLCRPRAIQQVRKTSLFPMLSRLSIGGGRDPYAHTIYAETDAPKPSLLPRKRRFW